jgi:hypothetical protein
MNSYKWKNFTKLQLLIVVAFIGLLVALLLPAIPTSANAQGLVTLTYPNGAPNFWGTDTNAFPVTLTNAQSATLAGVKKSIRQGKGISVFATCITSNSTVTTETVGFDLTYDGTHGTTTHPVNWTFAPPASAQGTLTTNTYWTNFPSAYLDNVRTLQATYATNNTAGGVVGSNSITTTLTYSQSGQ